MISKKIKLGLAGLCLFATLSTAGCGQKEQKPLLEGEVDGNYYKFFKQGPSTGKRIEVKKSDGTVLKYYDQGGDITYRAIVPYYVFDKSGYVETRWRQGYIDRIEIISPDGKKKVFKNSVLNKQDPNDPLMGESTDESVKAVKILADRTRQEYEKGIEENKKIISGEVR
jgi:hypothetical protein